MNSFLNLLKKELKELITPQFIFFAVVFPILIFVFIGFLAGTATKQAKELKIAVANLDHSVTSDEVVGFLNSGQQFGTGSNEFVVKVQEVDGATTEDAINEARNLNSSVLIVIPSGFEASLNSGEQSQLQLYSVFDKFEMKTFASSAQTMILIQSLNQMMAVNNIHTVLPNVDPAKIMSPLSLQNYLVIKGNVMQGTPDKLSSLVTLQTILIPVALMLVIIYCSQMMVSAIAMEKENKTLETLLTMPIKRETIIVGKMVAAALVGLIIVVSYMLGFYFLSGQQGLSMFGASGSVSAFSLKDFGLQISAMAYLVLGGLLFLSILFSLAFSLLLGIFAEDVKNAQVVIAPLMILVMIPYYLFMFLDLSSMSGIQKSLVLLDPFSYAILAPRTLIFSDYTYPLIGLAYVTLLLIVTIIILVRIFNTDKILTAKFNFSKFRK